MTCLQYRVEGDESSGEVHPSQEDDDGGDFVHGRKALQLPRMPLLRPALRAVQDFVWGT
jgi:hypothetical protein